jgi:hypothetical protein
MSNQTDGQETIDLGELYLQLYAFTDDFLKTRTFFRGASSSSFLAGKEVHDYVMDGIERYLRNPEKFNPSSGRSLLNYIRLHIIRSLIGNDLRSAENRLSKDLFAFESNNDEMGIDYVESMLPYAEAYFDEEMDYEKIMIHVEEAIKGDKIAEEIFLGLAGCGLKRREIIQEFGMTETEYNNGARRLQTILKDTALQFKLKKPLYE